MGTSKKWWDDVGLGPFSFAGKSMAKAYKRSTAKKKPRSGSAGGRVSASKGRKTVSVGGVKKGRGGPMPKRKRPSSKRMPNRRKR